jgi:predicted nucleotidyltransferase component of viral defense system
MDGKTMDFSEIRRLVIIAMFSDDQLMEQFVLKGGNALNIVHKLGERTSIDIDLSMAGDFDCDLETVSERIFKALSARFDSAGLHVFDYKFTKRPEVVREGVNPNWGGYLAEFKLIEKTKSSSLNGKIEAMRKNSTVIGPSQRRVFRVEISKNEFCEPKMTAELDDFTIYVYTLPMLAIEKLRAICQQLPEYPMRGYKTARARDFFDIYRIVRLGKVDLTIEENRRLIAPIFAAKEVPIKFLARIAGQREFHRPDWDAVVLSTSERLEPFDYYFDFVVALIETLQSSGIE